VCSRCLAQLRSSLGPWGTSAPTPIDCTSLREALDHGLLVPLTRRQLEDDWLALALGSDVSLGRQSVLVHRASSFPVRFARRVNNWLHGFLILLEGILGLVWVLKGSVF
jgi:hypothetical protein